MNEKQRYIPIIEYTIFYTDGTIDMITGRPDGHDEHTVGIILENDSFVLIPWHNVKKIVSRIVDMLVVHEDGSITVDDIDIPVDEAEMQKANDNSTIISFPKEAQFFDMGIEQEQEDNIDGEGENDGQE